MPNFTAIDFETANASRASACQVGLIKVRDGRIEDGKSWLIKPPAGVSYFDPFNTALHGINAAMVVGAPSWQEILPEIMSFIGKDLVIAHNAGFDISVLRQASEITNIGLPDISFLCTLVMARRTLSLPSYRLPFVTEALGIQFQNHHDALSDARAAAQIATTMRTRGQHSSLLDLADACGIQLGKLSASGYRGATIKRSQSGSALTISDPNHEADPDGYFYGQVVVFTGTLKSMSRQQAWDAVVNAGGTPGANTTKKTNILVVGNIDPVQLAPGAKLTGKAKRAFELQDHGQRIELMTEADFLQVLETASEPTL